MASTESVPSIPPAEVSSREILALKGGGFAVRIVGRAGRPILIYGFRASGEAEAWCGRMELLHAK
jgi:hypothetical protein